MSPIRLIGPKEYDLIQRGIVDPTQPPLLGRTFLTNAAGQVLPAPEQDALLKRLMPKQAPAIPARR